MNIIGAFDEGRIKTFIPRGNSILISITSHESTLSKVDKKWYKRLGLIFDDVDRKTPYSMTEEDAEKILDFVVENLGCDVFVNCQAGLSRSPAVVVDLEQIFNMRDVSDKYPHHNKFVKNMIKDVWFKRVWEGKEE